MVSAPDTKPTSRHSSPASARAALAAVRPYSTKLRPHLPQGCMPTPRTATFLSSAMCLSRLVAVSDGTPFPHQVLVVVILVEHIGHQFDRGADGQVVDADAGNDLAHDHHL